MPALAQLAAGFGADQVEHMCSIIAPKMLCRFQKAMHEEGELSDTKWYDECRVVLIREWPDHSYALGFRGASAAANIGILRYYGL